MGGAIIRVVDDIQDRFVNLKTAKFAKSYPLQHAKNRYDKYKELIRVPGIGLKSARRIRHMQSLGKKITSLKQLQELGANIKKCKIFVKVGGSYQSTLESF